MEQCVQAIKVGQKDSSLPSFKEAWYEHVAESHKCFNTLNAKDPNSHDLKFLRFFLSWIYNDPKYSASYYKNLVGPGGIITSPPQPNQPTQPSQPSHPSNIKPPQPKWATSSTKKGKGKGGPIGVGPLPPPNHPPPDEPAQPQNQPNTQPPTPQNSNPTKQQVNTDHVKRALDEATHGNQYNDEARQGIQKTIAELLEKLQQPIPPEQPSPTTPQKSLQEHLDHLTNTSQSLTNIQKMISTLYESLDVLGLELEKKRYEVLLAHQAYTDRAMEENLCRYKKREEAKQEHRNMLHQHWGNPTKMEEILDQKNQLTSRSSQRTCQSLSRQAEKDTRIRNVSSKSERPTRTTSSRATNLRSRNQDYPRLLQKSEDRH